MGIQHERACNTCNTPSSDRCIYVITKNAEQVGKCINGLIQPPSPCQACLNGPYITPQQPCPFNENNRCVNNSYTSFQLSPKYPKP